MKSNFIQLTNAFKVATLAGVLVVTGCGGDDDDNDSSTPGTGGPGGEAVTVTGSAMAPGGQVAQFSEMPAMQWVVNILVPTANAAVTGLQAVTGATVELVRIDDDGNQVGDVLASTVTSSTGEYNLALPSGVNLAGNLILRVSGNSGQTMSAMVVSKEVTISPVSEYVLNKFVESDIVLGDLPVNEVVALSGKIDEFDITATSNISSMLEQLEAEVGDLVSKEVTIISSEPGNGASAVGNWRLVEFQLGMHDDDEQDLIGTFSLLSAVEQYSVADAGNGKLNFTLTSAEKTFTNFNTADNIVPRFHSLDHETEISGPDDEAFPVDINAEGSMIAQDTFSEELESVDTNEDSDGPDFGWRYPSSTNLMVDTGNGNIKLEVAREASVRYETMDTNNDGVKDAIDPNNRSGDEVGLSYIIMMKHGANMSPADLNGNYGAVSMGVEVSASGSTAIESVVGRLSFNGNGNFTIGANDLEIIDVSREVGQHINQANLGANTYLDSEGSAGSYTVAGNGDIALNFGDEDEPGFVSDDGNFIVLLNKTTEDNGVQPNPTLIDAELNLTLMTRLADAAPSLESAVYDLYPLFVNHANNGETELASFASGSTLSFSSDAATADIVVTDKGFTRATDVSNVKPLIGSGSVTLDVTSTDQGMLTLDLDDDEPLQLKGYASADGKMLLMRLHARDETGNQQQDLGLVIAIKR